MLVKEIFGSVEEAVKTPPSVPVSCAKALPGWARRPPHSQNLEIRVGMRKNGKRGERGLAPRGAGKWVR
jgi:hypothetical protein